MAKTTINIRTDEKTKTQAQQVFKSIGLDLSTAINLFLKQAIKVNNIPFIIGSLEVHPNEVKKARRVSRYGVWKGKYKLPHNFDAPPT